MLAVELLQRVNREYFREFYDNTVLTTLYSEINTKTTKIFTNKISLIELFFNSKSNFTQ